MTSNERQRQPATPVVVARDNLKKQTETKGFRLQNETIKDEKTK